MARHILSRKARHPKETLTPDEVGQILGIRPQHVRELCKAGQLPCVFSGRNYHIPRTALDEFMLRGMQRC